MRKILKTGIALMMMGTSAWSAEGLVEVKSNYNVRETSVRLVNFFREKGIRLFKVIDHAEGARKIGAKLPPETLLIFGNPYLGTPLMECNPTIGIDLPQKMLVYENRKKETIIAYNDPEYLVKRHGISPECAPEIVKKMKTVLRKIADYAAGR